jgi:hypothetical protein
MVWVCHHLKYMTQLRLGFCGVAYISTLSGGGEKASDGFKVNKNHITVLVSSSGSDTHKLKHVIIGKHKKPRAFKNLTSFPVIYEV